MKTAFPSLNQPVTITLFRNVPFDNTYKNHPFNSAKFKYNNSAIDSGVKSDNFLYAVKRIAFVDYPLYPRDTITSDTFNFDYVNGISASIVLELTPTQTNANYMKVACGTDIYYYFITSITQHNYGTYKLTLECDVLMTYGEEFLEGMKNMPVFAKRKHCHRYRNYEISTPTEIKSGVVFSPDYKNGDSAFSGVKPSLVEDVISTTQLINARLSSHPTDFTFDNVLWLYVVCDIAPSFVNKHFSTYSLNYRLKNNKQNPFSILCCPLNANFYMSRRFSRTEGEETHEYMETYHCDFADVPTSTHKGIEKLIEEGHYKSAIVSPYPPFTTIPNSTYLNVSITTNGVGTKEINFNDTTPWETSAVSDSGYVRFTTTTDPAFLTDKKGGLYLGNNIMYFGDELTGDSNNDKKLCNWLVLAYDNDFVHKLESVSIANFKKPDSLSISSNRATEPKLLFEPFRKYTLSSVYGEEQEFYPELMTSYSPFRMRYNTQAQTYDVVSQLELSTRLSHYGGDYTTFTYFEPLLLANSKYGFANYKNAKVGLSSTMNYTLPVGTNALDVFKATQSETYYQSKIASGITSGLTIAGGVASVGLGIAGAVGSWGMSTPMSIGLISAGGTAIASGTANMIDTIKSTNAKIEDLKNTPNTINVSGSSYAHDLSMELSSNYMPFITKYVCSDVILHSADDYFYNYGYETSRECLFNTELLFDNDGAVDNNLFGRSIFNYIELQEDITNKINADIPLIVKQKLSSIFNSGITLWNFFGFKFWVDNNGRMNYDLREWYLKCTLDNTEYGGEKDY